MALVLNGSGITSANIADGTITTEDILASDVKNLKSGRKNLIINGGMQVSQRGDYTTATATTNGQYTLDRWQSLVPSSTATVQDTSSKIKYAATATATARFGGLQYVEDYSVLAGKVVTLSAKMTSNHSGARLQIYDGVSTIDVASHTGGGSEELITGTVTIAAGATQLRCYVLIASSAGNNVSITSGDYIEFTELQLELGSVATDFEHRSYGEELALCQRYYEKNGSTHWATLAGSADIHYVHNPVFNYAVTKRVTPTLGLNVTAGVTYQRISTDKHGFDMRNNSANSSGGADKYISWTADAEL